MAEPIIKLKDLEITYNLGKVNEFKATRGVTMDIYPGEFVAFFGPSGCGKSTIFYSILGILAPSAGQLFVKGENPYSFSPEEMVRFQTSVIGIIYQAFFLIPSLSVIDNVALPQIFQGVPVKKRRAWAKELLKRFDMEEHAEKYPENLSGGQSQRVSVSRSMVNNPNILLADEPTGNLDSVSTKQVMDALETINMVDKKTVIIITHNAAQLSYAHRVFYRKDGKVERIVPKPKKKQIAKIDKQKILVTEMDKLSKLFPYSSPTELKVKSVVNYLTQDLDFDQLSKLENLTQLMIERKISKDEFSKLLSRDLKQGGVGISGGVAETMANKVLKILEQSEDTRRFRRRFERNNFFAREDFLIKKLVYKRISGLFNKEEFEEKLQKTQENGGLSLDQNMARKLTLHFEKIIAQGSESKGHGH